MAELKEGLVGGAMNLYFIYKFLRILTTPFANTDAFKLGIIDEKGKILRKKKKLKTIEEKEAYTMFDRLVWKLKRLLEKVSFGRTRLASYAAALWLIKEEKSFHCNDEELQESFLSFLETDWKADAEFLQEAKNYKYGKTSASEFLIEEVEIDELYKDYPGKGWVLGTKDEPKKLKDKDIVWRSKVHHWDNDVRSNNTRLIIVKNKGKFDMWAKSDKSGKIVFHFGTKPTLDAAKEFASIRKWQQKKEEVEEGVSGPTRMEIQKFFDKEKGTLRARLNKTASAFNIHNVIVNKEGTVVGYQLNKRNYTKFKEEVEIDEKFAGWIAIYGGKKLEIKKNEADGLWPAKQLAIKHFKVPKSKQGLLAIKQAHEEVEEARSREDELELAKAIAAFKKKGGKIKKLSPDKAFQSYFSKGYKPKKQPRSEETEEEASTYRDRARDDEKKKKKHFAFGGKKKSRHGESGYGKGEEVEVDELVAPGKKSATGYTLYHKDFSAAMQHAVAHAKKKGHIVDPKEIDDKVATGPKKPSKWYPG